MRITKNELEHMIKYLNNVKGFTDVEPNTVGAFKLYKDVCGYAVHKICNSSGGVETVANSYGMSTKECFYFLRGLIAFI